MKSKRRAAYFQGCLYSIVFCLPFLVLLVFLLTRVYTIEGRGDPIGIVIAAVFIVLYLIFLKPAGKLFDFTEKAFMKCGDEKKAHRKAVLTEFFVFFVFLAACMFIVTILI